MSTSDGRLAFIKETTAGVTPAAPAFLTMDFTQEDFVQNVNTVRSNSVTPQRVVSASRRTSRDVGGGMSFELTKGAEIDALLASLMGNAFTGSPLTSKGGGSTADTYTFERKLTATDYRRFVGWRPSSADFTIAPEAIVTTKWSGVGYSMLTDNAIITGATYAAPSTLPKLTALDVVSVTLSSGLTTALDFSNLTFTLNNQLAATKRIGSSPVRGVRAGQLLATGQLQFYVPDKSVADAFNGATTFDMSVPIQYGADGYGFVFQNIALISYNDNNTGNNNEFIATADFECTLDQTYGSSFGITKTS